MDGAFQGGKDTVILSRTASGLADNQDIHVFSRQEAAPVTIVAGEIHRSSDRPARRPVRLFDEWKDNELSCKVNAKKKSGPLQNVIANQTLLIAMVNEKLNFSSPSCSLKRSRH